MSAPTQTPTDAAYIAANQAIELSQNVFAIVLVIVGAAAVSVAVAYLWHKPRPCGQHQFGARQDHVRDGEVWRPIYVRDVCTHCGMTVERTDALFDKPDVTDAQ